MAAQPSCARVGDAASSSGAHPVSRRRLIVHLDVNKTIIMSDAAAGAPMEQLLNSMIAMSAFGRVTGVGSSSTWTAVDAGLHTVAPAPGLMNYDTFVCDMLHPYSRPKGGESDEELLALRVHNNEVRSYRRPLIRAFTAEGSPGSRFRPMLDLLMRRLAVPGGGEGAFVHLVPAYFRMLEWLPTLGVPFMCLIRTFGSDGAAVALEHNQWVRGTHPHIPQPLSCVALGLEVALPEDSAAFSRCGTRAQDTRLACVARVPTSVHGIAAHASRSGSLPAVTTFVSGYRDVFDLLCARVDARPSGSMFVVQDDHSWWFLHGEAGEYGKVLPVDLSDPDTVQVFVDDNIGCAADAERILPAAVTAELAAAGITALDSPMCAALADTYIVDPRDIHTGHHVTDPVTRARLLVRADPISAILNPEYFVEVIKRRLPAAWTAAPA